MQGSTRSFLEEDSVTLAHLQQLQIRAPGMRIKRITEDLYPVVANPYTLLTCLTPELTWFTVLDLKDAFFCLPLHEASQKIFAFEWKNRRSGLKTQLTWTVLPQGFKNSPTLFGEQLAKDLEAWDAPSEEGKLLHGNQGELVHYDCFETIEATYSSCPDLKDTPFDDTETWFTDGSSYVISRKRYAGYAVTTSKKVIESGPLPTNTSAQKAELIALTRALEMATGRKINIYSDSRYAFGDVHAHGAIWKERGLLNSQGKNIKHAQEIMRLLEAVQMPEKVAIMHIKAHQKVSSVLEDGNELADREAKQAAKREVIVEATLIPDGQIVPEGVWGGRGCSSPMGTVAGRAERVALVPHSSHCHRYSGIPELRI
ncbi:uncharacterized protein LOC134564842 [Prinia subflava]|uniref:uncharacterized protein LOC134564842 n=1 Tax=Prinia subflava TaxID=208062 RepID=UPI002FE38685